VVSRELDNLKRENDVSREEKERIQLQLYALISQLEVEKKIRQELSEQLSKDNHSSLSEIMNVDQKTKILDKIDVNEPHEKNLHKESQPEDPTQMLEQKYIDQIRKLAAENSGLLEALKAAQTFTSGLEKEIQTYKNEPKKKDHKESATSTENELNMVITQLKAEKEALFEKNQANTKQVQQQSLHTQQLQTQLQQLQKLGRLWQTLLGVAVIFLAIALYI